jgi:hypothetical protein
MARPRQQRPPPLPDVPRATVPDAATQRAITSIITAIQSIIQFLRPFKQPEPWRFLLFEAGWQDYATNPIYQRAAHRKSPLGRVYLKGLVARASGSSTVIGVLPVGYRPPMRVMTAALSDTGIARVDVAPSGEVVLVSGGTTFVTLDGISFDTEA